MVNERYRIAMAETLHYLKGICQDDMDKIPNKFMTFLEKNASQDCKCEFDYTKPLNELNLKNETRGLIAMICLNYWCVTEEQKDRFKKHLNKNEKQYQEELMKKYNPDTIFKNNKTQKKECIENITINQNMQMIEYKNKFFIVKIINKLKKIFIRK